MSKKLIFKKGVHALHQNENINYQLNRAINWSNADVEVISKIAKKSGNIKHLIDLSYNEAVIQDKLGNLDNSIACYRLAEFFLEAEDDRKLMAYNRAKDLFYYKNRELFDNKTVLKGFIEYEQKKIPYYRVVPEGKVKDTLIIHGGFDSYMEEFFDAILYFRNKSYQVILFEGPGQGHANRIEKIPFTHKWEKIVIELHNKFNIHESTIIGLSLGAMLAPRAAAYEKRIKRVVSVGLMPDFCDVLISTRSKGLQRVIRILLKYECKNLMNFMMKKMMKKDMLAQWGVRHGMEIFGSDTPFDFLKESIKYNINDIGMNVTQDILITAGDGDHFIPISFYRYMLNPFKCVKSMTFRIFKTYEHAENHCQVGNFKLLLDIIDSWISERLTNA